MGYSNIEFPKGSKFLVTGAAGFIGSNLVESIINLGFEVIGIDNFSNGKKENVDLFTNNDKYTFIEGDIRNFEVCKKACKGIDYVLHQAALGSVPRSIREPLIYEDNNVKGTSNMMEAARLSGVKRFVYASSSSVYGDSQILPKVEGKEGKLLSPYALSKRTAEFYGKLYTEVYEFDCIGLRYFNVFGRRQDSEGAYAAVIPKFIKSLKEGKRVEIHGDGEQSRDFTYIENVIEANLKACLANKSACGKAYNIAFGERFTINEMYEVLCNKISCDLEPIYVENRAGDIKHSLANIYNSKKYLEYDPSWSFSDGFNEAVDWYLR